MQPALLSLDPSLPGFSDSLRRLDQLPSRNSDCAFVFCMRAGQKTPREVFLTCPTCPPDSDGSESVLSYLSISLQILGNVDKKTSISGPFLDFLLSLGCPEEVGGASRSGKIFV